MRTILVSNSGDEDSNKQNSSLETIRGYRERKHGKERESESVREAEH